MRKSSKARRRKETNPKARGKIAGDQHRTRGKSASGGATLRASLLSLDQRSAMTPLKWMKPRFFGLLA